MNSSSSSEENSLPSVGRTEASPSAGEGEAHELFADFREPLRGDLQYIHAALTFYHGGPADADVRGAWDRITLSFRDVRADYLRVLAEKVDMIMAATPPAESSAADRPTNGRECSVERDVLEILPNPNAEGKA